MFVYLSNMLILYAWTIWTLMIVEIIWMFVKNLQLTSLQIPQYTLVLTLKYEFLKLLNVFYYDIVSFPFISFLLKIWRRCRWRRWYSYWRLWWHSYWRLWWRWWQFNWWRRRRRKFWLTTKMKPYVKPFFSCNLDYGWYILKHKIFITWNN
jgi:hypothetical protein